MYWKGYSWSLLSIITMLVVATCVDAGEHGFKSSDPDLMSEFSASLEREGIPFREDSDGFLRYQNKYKETVDRLLVEIEATVLGGIAVRYDDKVSRDYLKGLLDSRGMPYRVEAGNDGEWIRWYPQNEAQRKEISMSVANHWFDLKRKRSGVRCNEKLPSTTSPNKDAGQGEGLVC